MIYVLELLSIVPIMIGLVLYILMLVFGSKDQQEPLQEESKKPNIAFLLPARNESKVIRGLLESIRRQTVKPKMKDVYIIVEDKEDPTCSIAKEYGATVLFRTTKKPRKGYALNEGLQQILKKHHYDLYFIFDADNILDQYYVEKMLVSYYQGYDIATGYRNCKNGDDTVIAGASTLIFSIINTIFNRKRKRNHKNITVSGTGFFIKGKHIEQWQGYPFHSLTEDYELSLYATQHNLKTDYVEDAIYYDEQPTTYQQTVKQRERWIAGYFEARSLYMKEFMNDLKQHKKKYATKCSEVIGVFPIIFILIGIVWYLFVRAIEVLISIFVTPSNLWSYLSIVFYLVVFVYIILWLITLLVLKTEKNKLNLSSSMRHKVLFYHPIFLLSYIPCALNVLLKKEIEWVPIEHQSMNMVKEK